MTKKEVYAMAEKLGVKKENLDLGMKKDEKAMTDMITKANKFKFKGKR